MSHDADTAYGGGCEMTVIRKIVNFFRWRKAIKDMPPRAFVDGPEARQARNVAPGETREQARKRLAKYRRMDG